MRLAVQKYGGATVRDAEHLRAVARRIAATVSEGIQVVVAISAMGNETDELLELPAAVSSVPSAREIDMLITNGERKAAALLGLALQDLGIPADSFTGAQAGIVTDGEHTQATIVEVHPDRIRAALDAGRVPVVGGAQGISMNGDVTFIGRGGTDTTAVALAGALGADACEIYSDVPGVFTADPRLVPDARLLEHVSFDEMVAMCHAGCPKPATSAVELARKHGVTLHVCSALEHGGGTWIDGRRDPDRGPVRAVVARLDGGGEPSAERDGARLSIVGPGVTDGSPAHQRMIDTLAGAHVETQFQTAASLRLTCGIDPAALEPAAIALHSAFGLGEVPSPSRTRAEQAGTAAAQGGRGGH